ncbi:Carboxylesterase [Thalictrum thalictroides]|uniref:Carboxylesterase n=1 Tax=Thalictrum thalictroides TaxID=46969 RepID=A0A7J6WZW6_THATH|nr:Carboxylesterase [Thalictrum thalictroides]
MADQSSSVDLCKKLLNNSIYNPDDDTLTRLLTFPGITCITCEDHNSVPNQPIFTQDIPLNATLKTWLRIYKPINPTPVTKLPLILYFHGSGFVIGTLSITWFHDLCTSMAFQLPAVVVSVGYRLAPESRLPAAYEDAMDAINWVRNQAIGRTGDSLLQDIVDYSNCYLMGTSSGGNMAYHAALRSLSMDIKPLKIRGIALNQPFFGGSQRTSSELRLINDKVFPLAMSDLMWELSLPKGSDRDHDYCNPMVNESYKDKIKMLGRCFVSVSGGDILSDRQMEFVKMLEKNGVNVVTSFEEEGYHGIDIMEAHKTQALVMALKQFLSSGLVAVGE